MFPKHLDFLVKFCQAPGTIANGGKVGLKSDVVKANRP